MPMKIDRKYKCYCSSRQFLLRWGWSWLLYPTKKEEVTKTLMTTSGNRVSEMKNDNHPDTCRSIEDIPGTVVVTEKNRISDCVLQTQVRCPSPFKKSLPHQTSNSCFLQIVNCRWPECLPGKTGMLYNFFACLNQSDYCAVSCMYMQYFAYFTIALVVHV